MILTASGTVKVGLCISSYQQRAPAGPFNIFRRLLAAHFRQKRQQLPQLASLLYRCRFCRHSILAFCCHSS